MRFMTEEEYLAAHDLVCFEPDEMFIDDFELIFKCRAATRDELSELEGAP